MNFDLDNIYRTFESVKETHDFKEYFDEMNANNGIC